MKLDKQLAIGRYVRVATLYGQVSGRVIFFSRRHVWVACQGRTIRVAKGRVIRVWDPVSDRERWYDSAERWAA